jgi:hypothetical protein
MGKSPVISINHITRLHLEVAITRLTTNDVRNNLHISSLLSLLSLTEMQAGNPQYVVHHLQVLL